MTVEAPPVSPEAPGPPREDSIGSAVLASAARGVAVFAIVTAVGVAIGLAEYAATNGAYRLWTWIKVGFLYLLSFCGVGLRVEGVAVPTLGPTENHLVLRLPMMAGTALILWLLFRAGRAGGRRTRDRGAGVAALACSATVVAFAVPSLLVSLPATLRFPDVGATIAPVIWEAAVLPFGLALSAVVAGAIGARRTSTREHSRNEHALAMAQGGWQMFLSALLFAFVGFLILAAVKPDQTGGYARFAGAAGRLGAVEVAHHALLLPDQSIWVLGPALGGSTQVVIPGAEADPTVVTLSGIEGGSLSRFVYQTEASNGESRVRLGGGFYLFLLVPLCATILGGRRAARGSLRVGESVLHGAGAGAVFGLLMAAGGWFSTTTIPLPLPLVGFPAVLPGSIYATMPSTAVLALMWGVVGGVLGALSSRWPASKAPPVEDQELAEPA